MIAPATDPAAEAEMREAAHLARRRAIQAAEAPPLTVRDEWPSAARPAAARKGTPGEWMSALAIAAAVYIALWVT